MKFDDFWGQLEEHAEDLPEGLFKVANPAIRDENGKLPVDRVFVDAGTAMPWFECDQFPTPQALMDDFDKPEELTAIKGPPSGVCIIRKSHLFDVKKREQVAYQVLKEHGIESFNDLGKLPMEKIMELRDEIKERVPDYGTQN